jgi:hypothetical protein
VVCGEHGGVFIDDNICDAFDLIKSNSSKDGSLINYSSCSVVGILNSHLSSMRVKSALAVCQLYFWKLL